MYIKRVIIRGFKTYKNETIIEDFSPHCNVVVGRNGSGKSNFFGAIRFVLSDAYNNMSREERQALIHESSVNIMSAFVEIIFDNSDRRIPIAKDEISIRRTIGMKKDDYSLDYKSATKSDIMNLLEASGFSKSNPYYIVPQGKVMALTNAKDSERLELLRDVAGAKVFENKLKDSLKEMAITDQKQDQINEMLNDIEKRLDELDIEREDLKSFEKLNSQKKMLEFNIFDREMKALTDQIEQLDDKYSNNAQESESLILELENREAKISQLTMDLNDLNSRKKILEIELEMNFKENQDVVQQISNLNVRLQEAKISSKSLHFTDSNLQKLNSLNEEITIKKEKLENLKVELSSLKKNETEVKMKINDLRQKQMLIISKKNQSSKFSSKKERDRHIKNEIATLNETNSKRDSEIKSFTKDLFKLKKILENTQTEKLALEGNDEINNEITKLNEQISDLKIEARNLVDDRSLLWRKESKLNNLILAKEEDLSSIEQSLRGGVDRMTLNALETVKIIAKRLGPTIESGVYGYLGELIDASEKYKTAVDVIGGNSLFHIVVNNDQTASILIEEMKKEKNCRATFIPLNRLKNEDFNFPSGNESVPLIKKIAYDEFLGPAVKQIFGRTVVCISIQKGYELANMYNVNAVTLDGDRCDNKGVLTGGFRDVKISRVDFLKNLRICKAEIYKLKEDLQKVKDEINNKDFVINTNYQKTTSLKNILDEKLNEKNDIHSQLSKIDNLINKYQQEISSLEQKLSNATASVQLIAQKISNLQDELETSFSQDSLTEDDEQSLLEIHNNLPLLEKSYQEMRGNIDSKELEFSSLSTTISENLLPRYNQLKSELENMNDIGKESNYVLEDLQDRLKKLLNRKFELNDLENQLTIDISDIKDSIDTTTKNVEDLNLAQESFVKQFEEYGKSTDKNLVKKVRLRNRKHELERNIGELGVLPEETLTLFAHSTTVDLSKKLTHVNEQLKSYNHVNKKALEQFIKFSKQRDSLKGRIEELGEAKLSINHLIKVLQNRKNEAIIRTFKDVSVGFAKIFEKLVPAGKGRLIIQKRSQEQKSNPISLSQYPDTNGGNSDDSEAESEDSSNKSIDSYVGISISVSFNSKKNEQLRLEQLSGGQKSLCALALILAIQNCDPAPFYLFDEIDSNLDAQYRTAVANLIHTLSRNAQFICTTFRPEMLKISDKFYGVMFNNKVSTISNIDSDRALDFVEDQHRV
ncbi:Structural maintenance of chromosomes protein 3 [Pichia californica]|uniref:Structural maintenance of chromosomes protein n=1 Tax=Pichia californica TaxID=460514 RepID=A0A9P7BHD7_9ASCO|nr:Structural maintenance of chromosomes protein 3 [[Candida] californica]KAG0689899.1 Structural maintenance of chromosomes protein 3 [[Candida] californica]